MPVRKNETSSAAAVADAPLRFVPPEAEGNGATTLTADVTSVLDFFKQIDREALRAAIAIKSEED